MTRLAMLLLFGHADQHLQGHLCAVIPFPLLLLLLSLFPLSLSCCAGAGAEAQNSGFQVEAAQGII